MGFRTVFLSINVCLLVMATPGGTARADVIRYQDQPVLIAVGSEKPADMRAPRRVPLPSSELPQWRQYRYPLPGYPADQARADFNGDGCSDIVILDNTNYRVYILESKRNTKYADPVTINCPEAGTHIVGIADFNEDGNLDILITSKAAKSHFQLIPGKGKMQFGKIVRFGKRAKDEGISQGLLTDIDGDGVQDIVALVSVGYSSKVGLAARNNGKGKFDLKRVTLDVQYDGIAAGDFDGDGFGDMLFNDTYTKKLVLYKSLGDGTFKAGKPTTCSSIDYDMYPFDIDGDGDLDLVGAAYNSWFRLNRGNGTFLSEKKLNGGKNYRYGAECRDINKDGFPELIVPVQSYGLNVHPGLKGPNFGPPVMLAPQLTFGNTSYSHVSCCDFDVDKKFEIAAANRFPGLGSSPGSNNLIVFEPDQSPATLEISNLVLTRKSFLIMLVYLTGSLDYSGENIDLRYVPGGADPTENAFLYFRYVVDLPWPMGDAYGYVRATGEFIHKPGEQSGTINFNFTLPAGVLIIGTLNPTVYMRDIKLYDFNLVGSNELD